MMDAAWIKARANDVRKADEIDPALYTKYNVKRGLRNADGTGVLVGLTTIGNVHGYVVSEGDKFAVPGQLQYRGVDVQDIAKHCAREHRPAFEEAAYLLLFGNLPTKAELAKWNDILANNRGFSPGYREKAIFEMPAKTGDLMNSLARAILAAYAYDAKPDRLDIEGNLEQSVDTIARMPMLAAYVYQAAECARTGAKPEILEAVPGMSTAEIFLTLLRGGHHRVKKLEADVLDLALLLHAEHGGGNNSSFVTHVVTSSFTDLYSSIAASILALKGSRHGGANLRTMRQMDEIKRHVKDWSDEGAVASYLSKIVAKKAGDGTGLIYGLGHAVYTLSDPRAVLLKAKAERLAESCGRLDEFKLYETVEAFGPQIIRKAHPKAAEACANVDLYSGFVYDMLGIPKELYTPLFAVARVVGWCAHRMEELDNSGPIVRPAYKPLYQSKKYVDLAAR